MQIPGFGEVGSSGMAAALGMSLTPVAILWKISLITLLVSIMWALERFVPRAEV